MLPVVTPRLATLVAACGLLVVFSPQPWWTLVGANVTLVVATLIDWRRAPAVGRVKIVRAAPTVMTLGGRDTITWTVANPTGRRLHVALADDLASGLGAPTRRTRVLVPPRGRARGRVDLRPVRRGRFVLRHLTVRVRGPWGLAARQGTHDLSHVLTVYPPFRSRAETELRLQRAQLLQLGQRSVRTPGAGMEFDSLREYTVDDEVRRIDWAATARATLPIVRTYRAERNQTVLLLVDCGRTMAALVGAATAGTGRVLRSDTPNEDLAIPRLEHAMDAAQALTRLATGLGDRVGMLAFADRVLVTVPPRTQTDQLRRVTAGLADLDARLVEADYRRAFGHALHRFPRRALLVVLTELASEAATQTLVPALPLLRRRHLVVVAAVRDPIVEGWRRESADTVEQTYRRAAAIRMLNHRTAVARQLRESGAIVADAVPGQLAAVVSDIYLQTKAAGRL